MRLTKAQAQEQNEARETLRAMLPPGSVVYVVLRHVSRSGMLREIAAYTIQNGEPVWISGRVAQAAGLKLGKRDGVLMGGCGMDMGFGLVYELSHALYPQGFACTGENTCPASDHNNGDREYSVSKIHSNGGYALQHRWM